MSDNFWARKLGVNNAPATQPFHRSNELYPLYAPVPETVPSQPVPVPQGQAVPQPQETYSPTVRMKQGETCPGCGGDKYFRSSPSHMPTCGECGYNPRFEQSAYGAPTLRGDANAPVAASRQVSGGQTMQGAIQALQQGLGEHI
ncbi:hypothetical protein HWB05_gp083 [Streptomyces phage BRock]|uniref:Uncharacterized protein n=1 Tax=Streptomyces phage BRock TaxID=1913591 RepID=A0A1J0GVY5_9CAUD|nr:hypothetical protein HWB05_gp083 [Streptomyces phage BRock]APC46345.1 hypothetical protein [Streptomyces phage BRock]